jgi:UDP-N-acetylglucosamine/UDP-N-acetylgalactosamine diphosphorylase
MLSLTYFEKNESQVFHFWSTLTNNQKAALISQLKKIDLNKLEQQKKLVLEPLESIFTTFEAFEDFAYVGNRENQLQGQRLIKQGRLGCLLLAGGQGTRLQFSGPKGAYPISVINHKSLFQLCAEKIAAASRWAHRPLNLAIMTSPDNDEETRCFFQHNNYFGLQPSQVSFFVQGSLPLLDTNGQLFLRTPWNLSTGPDGNGLSFFYFVQSGILEKWIQLGIDYVNVILVDNPLADPFDAELVGFHQKQGVEITLKCTEKLQAEERVGVLVKQNQRCCVVEYSEMSTSEKKAYRKDGRLKHCCANLSLFCFSLSFIQRIVSEQLSLPLHKAWKAAQYVDEEGISHLSTQPIAWKFETFIFDWLLYTQKVAALLYPREQCFAPLKNLTGLDSPDTVREALQQNDKQLIQALTGLPPPSFPFELAAEFHYPTPALRSKWQGRPITTSYVDPNCS